ncbi:MAG: phosphoglycerate dehydrogenase, partial [Thermoleophilia bacterium]|nr:phosphoglycerate dehydrogenase [Thermoleophilia bacterium]
MNGTMSVVALGDLAPECLACLEGEGLRVDARPELDEAGLLRHVAEYDALVAGPDAPVTAAALAAGTRLRVVGRAGVDLVGVDVAEATRRGIVVVNAPDSADISAAEHALA